VKIDEIWVPTTKLESGFGRVRYKNSTPWEFLHCLQEQPYFWPADIAERVYFFCFLD
jgi:hypothetical protein